MKRRGNTLNLSFGKTALSARTANAMTKPSFQTLRQMPPPRRARDCGGVPTAKAKFTVTIGTIFEDQHIPLRKWLIAWYLICSSKKGISSLQLQRLLELGSYRTALFMAHRIRHALKETGFP